MSETQDYNRHFGRVEEDEEDVPKQKDQDFYDNRLYMLFPVKILVFELEVVK